MKGHRQRLNESLRQQILPEEATILQNQTPAWTARLGSAQLVIFVVNSGMRRGGRELWVTGHRPQFPQKHSC